MRILYHHRTLGDGAEGIHIREMVGAFRDLGHDVEVVALVGEEGDARRRRKRSGWNRVSRWMPGHVYECAEVAYNVAASRTMAKAIGRFRPHFIYDRYNSYCTVAWKAARRARMPVLLEVNSPVAYERSEYENLRLKFPRLARWYEERICRGVDHIFAVSTPLKDFLAKVRRVPSERITVLPNGANPVSFQISADRSAGRQQIGLGESVVIGFVGILRPWHGVDMLVSAFCDLAKKHNNLHLLVVGDGPSEGELKREVNQRGLAGNVTFTGRVRHDEVGRYVAAMDIAVSPQATFYASPMKILEYMAMGVPCVAPDMPNIRDLLDDHHNGILFEPENGESLRAAIDLLISNADLAKQLGAAARQAVDDRLNWKTNAAIVIAEAERHLSVKD